MRGSKVGNYLDRLFEILSSLKLAVVCILGLAASLATGTILESLYDTPTSQYIVYRSFWFHALLGMLGVNIFCVAVSRWPWKLKHLPFLLAHAGIITLLTGSWMTEKFGLDGNVRVGEGETVSIVELSEYDGAALVVSDSKSLQKVPIPWVPPGVRFRPISARAYGVTADLVVDRFLSHADATFSFVANANPGFGGHPPLPAAQLRLQGGPMNITQDFWLWTGDASFRQIQMGPAGFAIGDSGDGPEPTPGQPTFFLRVERSGRIGYVAHSSDGKTVRGSLGTGAAAKGRGIQPGWKGGVHLTVLDWLPDAVPLTHYSPARIQYGQQAPPSAIHVVSGGAETWLGLGDRTVLRAPEGQIEIAYQPKRVYLPFGVKLDHFLSAAYWSASEGD